MKIIHFCESLSQETGGPARSVSQLCNELQRQGCEVIFVQRKPIEKSAETEEFLSQDILCLSIDELQSRKLKGDCIAHTHGIWSMFNHASAVYCQKHNIPMITAPRGMLAPWALNYRKWKKKLAWLLYQKQDLKAAIALHATAEMEAEDIRRLGLKQPIAVIPNGVSPISEKPLSHETFLVKKRKKRVLFLSRIHPKKGIPLLLKSWATLRSPEWELVIAGNEQLGYQTEMINMAKTLRIEDSVSFPGPLYGERKDSVYRFSDLFVLPTYSENFGIVVAEALQYGIPVITTTGTPWAELRDKECGWWVEPTEEAIGKALQKAFSLPESTLHEMGENGRKLIQEKYEWTGIARNMKKVYEWMMTRGVAPSCIRMD